MSGQSRLGNAKHDARFALLCIALRRKCYVMGANVAGSFVQRGDLWVNDPLVMVDGF